MDTALQSFQWQLRTCVSISLFAFRLTSCSTARPIAHLPLGVLIVSVFLFFRSYGVGWIVQNRRLQAQCRTAEDQLQQSLEREAELRAQVGDPSTIISKLGAQNDALHTENNYFFASRWQF